MTYRLTDEAKDDYREIKTYLTREGGTQAARHVQGELRRAMRFLADRPGAGHSREDLTDRPLKFWPVFSYLIVYYPDQNPLPIARILHSARDIEVILRKHQ